MIYIVDNAAGMKCSLRKKTKTNKKANLQHQQKSISKLTNSIANRKICLKRKKDDWICKFVFHAYIALI